MSVTYRCDVCNKTIANPETQPVFEKKQDAGKPKVQVRLQRSVDGRWNGGQVCDDCLVEIVSSGKRVPS